MSKLNYENKINIYNDVKQGNTINNVSKKYGVRIEVIKYLVKLKGLSPVNYRLQSSS